MANWTAFGTPIATPQYVIVAVTGGDFYLPKTKILVIDPESGRLLQETLEADTPSYAVNLWMVLQGGWLYTRDAVFQLAGC